MSFSFLSGRTFTEVLAGLAFTSMVSPGRNDRESARGPAEDRGRPTANVKVPTSRSTGTSGQGEVERRRGCGSRRAASSASHQDDRKARPPSPRQEPRAEPVVGRHDDGVDHVESADQPHGRSKVAAGDEVRTPPRTSGHSRLGSVGPSRRPDRALRKRTRIPFDGTGIKSPEGRVRIGHQQIRVREEYRRNHFYQDNPFIFSELRSVFLSCPAVRPTFVLS